MPRRERTLHALSRPASLADDERWWKRSVARLLPRRVPQST